MRSSLCARTALAFASVACLGLLPQDAVAPAEERFVLEPGEHDLLDVLDRAAKYLDRNYIVAPGEAQQLPPILLQRRITVDRAGCETVLGQLAYARGLALVPRDPELGLWDVVNLNGPRRNDVIANRVVVPAEDLQRYASSKTYIATRIALRHVDASQAAQMLRPFLANNKTPMQVGSLGPSALLLSGFGDDVAAAARLIDLADLPSAELPDRLEQRLAAIEARLARLEANVAQPGKDR